MSGPADQDQAVGLMAAHEAGIAELYRFCADRFPEHAGLFRRLSHDEVNHARLLAALIERVRDGSVRILPGRFASRAILDSLDRVRECIREVQAGHVTPIGALSSAADIEENMIESRCLETANSDDPEVQRVLTSLAADTESHRDAIRRAWEKQQPAGP